jgi:uncharacterized glyoxalase superfamily protein PhnB
MRLVQSRIVTEDVAAMATFYATLLGSEVTVNDYYVEVPSGDMSVGFSKPRFTEYQPGTAEAPEGGGPIILDFVVDDVDAEYGRIAALGVEWVMPPRTQPWGRRSMVFRDPEGNLVNVSSPVTGDT